MKEKISRLSIEFEILNKFSVKELSDINNNLGIRKRFPQYKKMEAIQSIFDSIGYNIETLIYNLNISQLEILSSILKLDFENTRYDNQLVLLSYFKKLKEQRLKPRTKHLIRNIDKSNYDRLNTIFSNLSVSKKIILDIKELAKEIVEVIENLYISDPFHSYTIYFKEYIYNQLMGESIKINSQYISIYLLGSGNPIEAAISGHPNFFFNDLIYYVDGICQKGSIGYGIGYGEVTIKKEENWKLV